jgi:hypothetical protein
MNLRITDLAIGPGIPLLLSALWYGLLRQFMSKAAAQRLYTEAPMKFVVPIVLLALSAAIIIIFWKSRRLASYGTIGFLILGLVLMLAVLQQGGTR